MKYIKKDDSPFNRMPRGKWMGVLLLACVFGALPAKAQNYTVTGLSLGGLDPAGNSVGRKSINALGQVAGGLTTREGYEHAFFYDGTTMHDLGTLGGQNSYATAINATGQIVGNSITADGQPHAFLYDGGKMQDLGTLGGKEAYASGINALGQVVGISLTANGSVHAFLYTGGKMQDLGTLSEGKLWLSSEGTDINAVGQIAGTLSDDSTTRAFLYDSGTLQNLGVLGGEEGSWAVGINDSGKVIGNSNVPSDDFHAFLYDGHRMLDLGTLGGDFSTATDLNNAGQVVGLSSDGIDNFHAFLYTAGKMQDLGKLPGSSNSYATAINSSGQVIGVSVTTPSAPPHAFLYDGTTMQDLNDLTLTPDPAGMILENPAALSDDGSIVVRTNQGLVLLSPERKMGSLVVPVSQSFDDAEEELPTGRINLNSTDLEMIKQGGLDHLVGIRFNNLTIPPGARIVDAHIQFTADETNTRDTSLTVWAEAIGNAATFSNADFDISSRPTTVASVSWHEIPAWDTVGANGPIQATPNLAPIVQEVIGHSDWSPGNAMAFIFGGKGKRVAESFNGTTPPVLHITYEVN